MYRNRLIIAALLLVALVGVILLVVKKTGQPYKQIPLEKRQPSVERKQTKRGAISGQVLDTAGRPMPDVNFIMYKVELLPYHSSSSYGAPAKTDARGFYRIEDLSPADYAVTAKVSETLRIQGRKLTITRAGEEHTQNFDLRDYPYALEGVVLDEEGGNVPGAKVELTNRTLSVESITDAEGKFRLTPLDVGEYGLKVESDDYAPTTVKIQIKQDKKMEPVTVVLAKGESITGQVTDEKGRPIEGAKVQIRAHKKPQAARFDTVWDGKSVLSDAQGHFQLEHLQGHYHLLVSAEGYGTRFVRDVPAGDEPIAVKLTPGATISGRVYDRATGVPQEGVTVTTSLELEINPRYYTSEGASAKTDADGRYSFTDLGPGAYELFVRAVSGGVPNRSIPVAEGTYRIDFPIERWQRISGKVTDDETGEPLADVRVRADGGSVGDNTITNLDGAYTLDRLIPGEYRFRLSTPRYVQPGPDEEYPPVRLEAGQDLQNVNFTLVRGSRVSGKVTDKAGKPLPGVKLSLLGGYGGTIPTAKTNEKGEYVIQGVRPVPESKKYFVEAELDGYAQNLSKLFAVNKGMQIVGVDLVMTEGGAVSGVVRDEAGKPIEGVVVKLTQGMPMSDGGTFGVLGEEVVTDAEGRYAFKNLKGEGFEIKAMHEQYGAAPEKSFGITDGQNLRFDLTLERGGVVAGRVTDERGEPVSKAEVMARSGAFPYKVSTTTDEKGRYRIDGLKGLSWKDNRTIVTVQKDGFSPDAQEVELNREDIDFTLKPFGGIALKIVDAARGEPISSYSIQMNLSFKAELDLDYGRKFGYSRARHARGRTTWIGTVEHFSSPLGRFERRRLPVGTAEGLIWREGFAPASFSLEVDPGQVNETMVRLSEGGILRGRVYGGEQRTPLGNVQVIPLDLVPRFGYGAEFQEARIVRTASDGAFTLPHILPGEQAVLALSPDFAPALNRSLTVSEGQVTDVEVFLTEGGRVEGIVRDKQGNPLKGKQIGIEIESDKALVERPFEKTWLFKETLTDENGFYTIDKLMSGKYAIGFIEPNNFFRMMKGHVIIEERQTVTKNLQF